MNWTLKEIGQKLDWELAELALKCRTTGELLRAIENRIDRNGRDAFINSLGELQNASGLNALCGRISILQDAYRLLTRKTDNDNM